jgi:hypothetical protein
MAALVILALFWGNCFSCPQVLLSLASHKASHECCKRGQKPASKTCDTQGLRHFVKSDSDASAAPAMDATPVEPASAPAIEAPAQMWVAAAETVHAPPDRLALHSVLRI